MPKAIDPVISQAEVRGRFDYNPETGVFTDKATGKAAGTPTPNGYLRVQCGGRSVGLHRLAFMWMCGHWPLEQVDHVNGDPSDNRWSNLRPATARQNAQNRRPKDANFGYKGVQQTKSGRWVASIVVNGKIQKIPGTFESAYAAHQAYRAAATRMFGQFVCFEPRRKGKPERVLPVDVQLDELERRKADLESQLRNVKTQISSLCPDRTPEEEEMPGKYATRAQVLEYERKLRARQLEEWLAKRAEAQATQ